MQGADADHLKTPADVDRTAAAGFTFFTIDPSDHVDAQADDYDADHAGRQVRRRSPTRRRGSTQYRGKTVDAAERARRSTLDDAPPRGAAVKYGRAINHAVALADHIDRGDARSAARTTRSS